MNPTTLAISADLLAAFGVIVSLLFLTYELRRSNKDNRLANWRELLGELTAYKGLSVDPVLSDLIERGNADFTMLSPAEKRSYGMYLEQGIHIIGNFPKHAKDMPVELAGLDRAVVHLMRDLINTQGGREWWAATKGLHRFMPNTEKTIEDLLAKYEVNSIDPKQS